MTVRTRRFRLRGVHYLYDPKHQEPKHGHEYFLEVSVKSHVPAETVHSVLQEEILSKWDKQDWNSQGLQQASGELLVEEFDRVLRATPLKEDLVSVVLRETSKNRFISSLSNLAHGEY